MPCHARTCLWALVLLLAAAVPYDAYGKGLPTGKAVASAAPAAASALAPFDDYFGVYVNKQKVGWMRWSLETGKSNVLRTELLAKVSGMGQTSEIGIHEERTYDSSSGMLMAISFVQSASTGEVRVTGKRADSHGIRLEVTAGGVSRTQEVAVSERLQDALAATLLARNAKVGDVANATQLDTSIQKVVRNEHKVMAVERRIFAGVETQAVKMTSTYPDLGVSESLWLDNNGKVLESRMGGIFVLRLEPPSEAKRLDYQQDLLVSNVVQAPQRLVAQQNIQKLMLRMGGFGEHLPPVSSRQQVTQQGNDAVILLQKDAIPKRIPLNQAAAHGDKVVQDALLPTPFIQSDAPELVAAAQKAIGGAKDVFSANTKLIQFVDKHMHKEYVPAYSNALEAYKTARGDCTEHSVLYVALARALNIPARVAVGVAYWAPGDGFGWHAWAEIWAGDRWIAVDPTWNQPIADATHIKLADGDPSEQARIVMLLGQLKIIKMETS